MRAGLSSFAYTWAIGVAGHSPPRPLTALGMLSEAARLGAEVVQVCDNLPLTHLRPVELDAFAGSAADAGIAVEVGTRGICTDNLLRHLDLARRLGSPFVRVVTDLAGDEPSLDEAIRRLRDVSARFREAGRKIAIENHDRFTCAELVTLVEELGTDVAGVCIDTVNSFGALEPPASVVAHLAPHALSLHVKDFTIRRTNHQMGFVIEGCAAGTGRLDLHGLIRTIRQGSRQPCNAVIETWVTPGPDLEETISRERAWTELGLSHLKSALQSVEGIRAPH